MIRKLTILFLLVIGSGCALFAMDRDYIELMSFGTACILVAGIMIGSTDHE